MLDRLAEIETKYEDLAEQINDPDVIANQTEWRKRMKEYSDMTPIVEKYREYKQAKEGIAESLAMLEEKQEEDFRELLKEELAENKEKAETLKQELTLLLIPKDPNDEKNVIMEIRGGAGGDEAALFAGDLFRMYARYAERVPVTESGGRVHTSTVTVAVLPEAEEVDVHIDMNDVRVDVFRASGNGGQCVNTTDSAVRMTHIPTGIVVTCQNEKSQLKNKEQALKVLYARVYERERRAHDAAISADRRSQVGTGDRSERIRTYNFPQGRVTDHRIGLTLHKIDAIMDGDLNEMMDTLATTDRMAKMQET